MQVLAISYLNDANYVISLTGSRHHRHLGACLRHLDTVTAHHDRLRCDRAPTIQRFPHGHLPLALLFRLRAENGRDLAYCPSHHRPIYRGSCKTSRLIKK